MANNLTSYMPNSDGVWVIVNKKNVALYTAEWYDDWDENEPGEEEKFCEHCRKFQDNASMKLLRIENVEALFAAQFGYFCTDCAEDKKAVQAFIEMALIGIQKTSGAG